MQISERPNPFIALFLKAPRGLGQEEDRQSDLINLPQDWPLILIYKYASINSSLQDSCNPLSSLKLTVIFFIFQNFSILWSEFDLWSVISYICFLALKCRCYILLEDFHSSGLYYEENKWQKLFYSTAEHPDFVKHA